MKLPSTWLKNYGAYDVPAKFASRQWQSSEHALGARHLAALKAFYKVVRTERLELSHLAAPEPKSGASTNSATFAFG